MPALFVAALIILGMLFPSFGRVALLLFFWPLFSAFFGCGIWLLWNVFTGFGSITMDAWTTSCFLGCFPGALMTLGMTSE